jgi:hypothetical protein
MSEQNVAVVRRWVELFNERDDAGEFLSLLDPEVELQTPGGPRLRGHAEARHWFEAGHENVQPRIISERFVAEGDVVVGLGRTEVRWISRARSLTSPRARERSGFATGRSSGGDRLKAMPLP